MSSEETKSKRKGGGGSHKPGDQSPSSSSSSLQSEVYKKRKHHHHHHHGHDPSPSTHEAATTTSSWASIGPLAQIFNVHKAIRTDLKRFLDDINMLTIAASDQVLDELLIRIHFFRTMMHDHCVSEDQYIVPALLTKAAPNKAVVLDDLVRMWDKEHNSAAILLQQLVEHLQSMRMSPLVGDEEVTAVFLPNNGAVAASGSSRPLQSHQMPPSPASPSNTQRPVILQNIKVTTESFVDQIESHLDDEETALLPEIRDIFSPSEQGELLVTVLSARYSAPVLPWTLRVLSFEERLGFLGQIEKYASDAQLVEVVSYIANSFPAADWHRLVQKIPRLGIAAQRVLNPLVEITNIHKAIRAELENLVSICDDFEEDEDLRFRFIIKKLMFLQKVLNAHSDGEDSVIIPALRNRLPQLKPETSTSDVNAVNLQIIAELGSSGASQHVCNMSSLAESIPLPSHSHPSTATVGDALKSEPEPEPEPNFKESEVTCLENHEDEIGQIQLLIDRFKSFLATPEKHKEQRVQERSKLSQKMKAFKEYMFEHMAEEEGGILPLLRQHFSVEDQDSMVRRAVSKVPSEFVGDVFPWMMDALSIEDKVVLLRNVLRTASSEEFHSFVAVFAKSVQKGAMRRSEWDQIVLRVPEVKQHGESYLTQDERSSEGPVSEIYRVHKAIRIELQRLLGQIEELCVHEAPNPNHISIISQRFLFLKRMVEEHSRAEDEVVLPALEERIPGISQKYHEEHCGERDLFVSICTKLERLQCAADSHETLSLLQSVRVLLRVLRDDMFSHLDEEEIHLWPYLVEYFTVDEQAAIVGKIFGQIPGDRLREMLPWMIHTLSAEEQQSMMTHLLSVTRSTMFEKWLMSWFPLMESILSRGNEDNGSGNAKGQSPSMKPQPQQQQEQQKQPAAPTSADLAVPLPAQSPVSKAVADESKLASLYMQGKEDLQRAIRAIAQDDSLSAETKTRLMQNLMLSSWENAKLMSAQKKAERSEAKADAGPRGSCCGRSEGCSGLPVSLAAPMGPNQTYLSERTFHDKQQTILGCQHYQRKCRMVAKCCGKIYTCRLCHDAVENHAIDRYATEQMVCMCCGMLQPVGHMCSNPLCGLEMAHYYCPVCKLWDDDERHNIYHCHCCNVCRVGKGLGVDNIHCMKCNACIRIEHFKSHRCIERVLESDCPICHQNLFFSTVPIKYLHCGHLMHTECYLQYAKRSMKCPLCQKSLEDMSIYFARLDVILAGEKRMPSAYQTAECKLRCNDCSQSSNTPFHFLYNKCPKCNSYNTQVLSVDPNAGDHHR